MSDIRVAAIVEGHGECEALPILLRRIALDIDPAFVLRVLPPLRIPSSRLLKDGEVERAVELAGRKLQGQGGILVVLDCDWPDGCPAKEGPALLKRAHSARSDMIVSVVLAKQEFEAWFLAAAESLRGKRGLPSDLDSPPDPEVIRGAKEWLSDKMGPTRGYAETTDQPALTGLFDMSAERRRAPSFEKFYRDVTRMLKSLRGK
jgi:hypothetical protein